MTIIGANIIVQEITINELNTHEELLDAFIRQTVDLYLQRVRDLDDPDHEDVKLMDLTRERWEQEDWVAGEVGVAIAELHDDEVLTPDAFAAVLYDDWYSPNM